MHNYMQVILILTLTIYYSYLNIITYLQIKCNPLIDLFSQVTMKMIDTP